jgi:hypothetical protein
MKNLIFFRGEVVPEPPVVPVVMPHPEFEVAEAVADTSTIISGTYKVWSRSSRLLLLLSPKFLRKRRDYRRDSRLSFASVRSANSLLTFNV